jgi:hypothetical protein
MCGRELRRAWLRRFAPWKPSLRGIGPIWGSRDRFLVAPAPFASPMPHIKARLRRRSASLQTRNVPAAQAEGPAL